MPGGGQTADMVFSKCPPPSTSTRLCHFTSDARRPQPRRTDAKTTADMRGWLPVLGPLPRTSSSGPFAMNCNRKPRIYSTSASREPAESCHRANVGDATVSRRSDPEHGTYTGRTQTLA